MKICIVNFSNWLGYHIVEGLLSEGYDVYILKPKAEGDFFLDFFSRHSHFTVLEDDKLADYDAVISLECSLEKGNITAEKHLVIPTCEAFQSVILFGEWMPMNEEGVYHCGEYITFTSTSFQKKAISVSDVVNLLLKWLRDTDLIGTYILQSVINDEHENTLLLQSTTPIEEKLQAVRSHYEKYAPFYPQSE